MGKSKEICCNKKKFLCNCVLRYVNCAILPVDVVFLGLRNISKPKFMVCDFLTNFIRENHYIKY